MAQAKSDITGKTNTVLIVHFPSFQLNRQSKHFSKGNFLFHQPHSLSAKKDSDEDVFRNSGFRSSVV